MSNPKAREEEYLRRMKERGYIPSLAGMDDDDIEWALERMDRRQVEPQAPQLGRTIRPPDRDFAERIFNMFKRPFDPNWQMPNLDGPEFQQTSFNDPRDVGARPIDPYLDAGATRNNEVRSGTANKVQLKFSEGDNPDWDNVHPTMKDATTTFVGNIQNQFGSQKNPWITSGYRDPQRNEESRGAKNSWHLHGLAADLWLGEYTPEERAVIEQMAKEHFEEVLYHDTGTGIHLHVGNPRRK